MNDSTLVSLKHIMDMCGCLCGALSCRHVQLPPLERAALLQPLPLLLSHPGGPRMLVPLPQRLQPRALRPLVSTSEAATRLPSLGRQPRALTRGHCQVRVRASKWGGGRGWMLKGSPSLFL